MPYYAVPEGTNFAVYQAGGTRVSTVALGGLVGFGLSTGNLGSPASGGATKTTTTPAPAAPAAPAAQPNAPQPPAGGNQPDALAQMKTQLEEASAKLAAMKGGTGQSTTTPSDTIHANLPGGNATNLYDYFSAKGQTLPSVADRSATYEQLGLGPKADYTGSAEQNIQLLEKLQLNDHSVSTFGSPAAQASAGMSGSTANPVNTTDAGISLASALAGHDAATSLDNYKTYLATSLGVAADKVSADESAINSFFDTGYKTADQILSEEMDRQGVGAAQGVLTELDKEIATQQALVDKLPGDIKTTLQDVGVSQAQLDRLTAKEVKPATDALNTLLKNRSATSTEIDKAMTYAKQFADTRVSAQAAKLSYLEWQITSDKGDYAKLDADVKSAMTTAVNDQKSILSTALTAAKNGATSDVIDSILGSSSAAEAIQAAGHALVTPKKTTASSTPTAVMSKDISSAGTYLEVGLADKGYNGRGPDGFVDPNLYVALYNAAEQQYGASGAASFIKKYPPAKNINPANIGAGTLPTPISNAVLAGQKVKSVTTIK